MKELQHPFIVDFKQSFVTNGKTPDEVYLNIVMEFIPDNSYKVMKQYNKMKEPMPALLIKLYSFQMMRSLAYLHTVGICHRDIKPQNLLINQDIQVIKLCDFGSAKKLVKGEPNVSYICSRYYRAPELIFGCSDYSPQIDVWSTGCVIAEFILGQPLFPGENGVDQLVEIIKVLGTPNKDQILAMNPNYKEHKFPQIKPVPFQKVFKSRATEEAMNFLSKLLVYSPKERYTPVQAMADKYFDELRDKKTVLPNGKPLPEIFNFTKEELKVSGDMVSVIIPKWYKH